MSDQRQRDMLGMRSFIAAGVKPSWEGAARDIANMITEKDEQITAQAKTIHEQQEAIIALRARVAELEHTRTTVPPSNGKGGGGDN